VNKIALVTGATSGIGKATALILAKNGYDVIITGRRDNLLGDVAIEIIDNIKSDCYPLCFDIRDIEQTKQAFIELPEKWKNIELLINNAGLAAGLAPIHEGDLNDWNQMIDTNIKGLLNITKIVSKIMIKKGKGQIINVSSIAGKEAYKNGTVYCGTKHAVEAITKGMRIDLNPYNIKVGSISPGAVETEFSIVRLKDENANTKVYAGFTPLQANDIAESILFMVNRPAHVNINDIFITPIAQATATIFNKK